MMDFKKSVLTTLILISLNLFNIFSQESPKIRGIIYNEDINQYTISWIPLQDVANYMIYPAKGSMGNTATYGAPIMIRKDTNNWQSGSFFPDNEVIFFAVEALYNDGKKSTSNLIRKPFKDAPSNVVIKSSFDSCKYVLHLSWNQFYYTSDTSQNKFNLIYNGKFKPMQSKTSIDLDYNFLKSVAIDSAIKFSINLDLKAPDGQDLTVMTKPLYYMLPKVPNIPTYIEATGTSVWDISSSWTLEEMEKAEKPSEINLSFKTNPENEITRFALYRDDELMNNTLEIATGNSIITYSDKVDSLLTKNYKYYIAPINTCNEAFSIKSNLESNMRLDVTYANKYNIIEWDTYSDFKGKNINYYVYRIRAGSNEENITGEYTKFNSGKKYRFLDELYNISNIDIDEKVCYYVRAEETDNPNGINGSTRSNLGCVILSTYDKVEMPKYLRLGDNCTRAPKPFIFPGGYSPLAFQMFIFDRWGTKIFESPSYNEGWDGTSSGKVVPQGGYVYYIKITNQKGKSQEFRGSVMVLCP